VRQKEGEKRLKEGPLKRKSRGEQAQKVKRVNGRPKKRGQKTKKKKGKGTLRGWGG